MQSLLPSLDSRTKFLTLFLVWILCLGVTTLSIQHSCEPLIGQPSEKCRVSPLPIDSIKSGTPITEKLVKNDLKATPPVRPKPEPPIDLPVKPPPDRPKPPELDRLKSPECDKLGPLLVAGATGAGSAMATGVGALGLANAGVIAATATVGGVIVSVPLAAAVATGILIFLAVKKLTGGSC